MKTIFINRFDRGIADGRFNAGVGEFQVAKQFDVLTHPHRLQPLRGMNTHTANTGIGNLIVASDGLMYGIGIDANNPSNGKLWVNSGYGASDNFAALSTNQLSGTTVVYDLFVDWPDTGNSRKIIWASNNLLVASNYSGGAAGATTQALTFSSIGQGLVFPNDTTKLYFPYRNATTPYIGLITSNATPFTGLNATALTLPLAYQCYGVSFYGNYLAIPLTGTSAVSLANSSVMALWDRDTSQTTFSEVIPWGNGRLLVSNNLGGTLIGVSLIGDDSLQAGTSQDFNGIEIKGWAGGFTFKKTLKAIALSGASGKPSVSINSRVNFIYNDRLYFSVNVNPNDGIQPSRIGLWSVGKNKLTGEWTVTLERTATNDNSETSVIAAAIVGDYVEMVHTAAGTLTNTINGNASSGTYGATSVYETTVNPDMDVADSILDKKLMGMAVIFEPLPASATVTMKYRVESKGATADWVTVATASTAGTTFLEMTTANGTAFTNGRNYEFRLESTGGAVITGFAYKYNPIKTLLP